MNKGNKNILIFTLGIVAGVIIFAAGVWILKSHQQDRTIEKISSLTPANEKEKEDINTNEKHKQPKKAIDTLALTYDEDAGSHQPSMDTIKDFVSDELIPENGEHIAQDQLIKVKNILVKKSVINDSISSNIKEMYIKVEFWKSPINYTGYKLGQTTLILFGIPNIDSVYLIQKEDRLYLQYNQRLYELEKNNAFINLDLKK